MSKNINVAKHPADWEPMKYWSMPNFYTNQQRQDKLNVLLRSDTYIFSEKKDGNLGRFVWFDGDAVLQSRSVSKITGEYSELQHKVLFFEKMKSAFTDTTVLLGEIYYEGGRDKEVGTILRCLPDKAINRQNKDIPLKFYIFDCLFYNGINLTQTPIKERIKYLEKAAKAIDSELVSYAKYYTATMETFYDRLNNVFTHNGEGVVLYHANMLPCEGRTSAWDTIKVKRELQSDIDCFISGVEPPKQEYTGKEVSTWNYWYNDVTGEKLFGCYYNDYTIGKHIIPVTKSFFYDWPGAIVCSVYNNDGSELVLCKCSNLTDELRKDLSINFDKYDHHPVRITGMMMSEDKDGQLSVRHPKLINLRDDIDDTDCLLCKIL